MSGPVILLLALAGWFAIGFVLAFVLGRRGHDGLTWLVLGALSGPVALALAVDARRHGEDPNPQFVAASPVDCDDARIDVLIGFDESAESHAAIASVIELFGARLGRLSLVTVIPFDGAPGNEWEAGTALRREAEHLAWLAPALEIVRGLPATVLVAAAASGGFDVLAVGTTGAGHAHLFGSAARQLAAHSTVPVLLTGQSPQAA